MDVKKEENKKVRNPTIGETISKLTENVEASRLSHVFNGKRFGELYRISDVLVERVNELKEKTNKLEGRIKKAYVLAWAATIGFIGLLLAIIYSGGLK